jgi:hypothetical protein
MNKAMIIVTIGFAAGVASGAGVALATTAGISGKAKTHEFPYRQAPEAAWAGQGAWGSDRARVALVPDR